jgi:hypothetical protein
MLRNMPADERQLHAQVAIGLQGYGAVFAASTDPVRIRYRSADVHWREEAP